MAVTKIRFVYLTLLACIVAIGMQVVGALLITALLIIPAATARKLASTPEQMALLASGFGGLAVLCGMLLSWYADTPAGHGWAKRKELIEFANLIDTYGLFGLTFVIDQTIHKIIIRMRFSDKQVTGFT